MATVAEKNIVLDDGSILTAGYHVEVEVDEDEDEEEEIIIDSLVWQGLDVLPLICALDAEEVVLELIETTPDPSAE